MKISVFGEHFDIINYIDIIILYTWIFQICKIYVFLGRVFVGEKAQFFFHSWKIQGYTEYSDVYFTESLLIAKSGCFQK